jgi:hypothetical protein
VVKVPSSLRQSVDVFSIEHVLPRVFVSSMWKSSLLPLKTLEKSLYELIIKMNDLYV